MDVDELIRPSGRAGNERAEAFRFLRDLLADGPHRASEAFELAEDAGITKITLKRAKTDLGVVSYQRRDDDEGKSVWWWELPDTRRMTCPATTTRSRSCEYRTGAAARTNAGHPGPGR